METIWVCVYRDTIEEHDDDFNLAVVQVTKSFLRRYFNEYQKEYYNSMENFLDEYTADDTQDFYSYATKYNAVLGKQNW